MELVRGIKITDYGDQANLSTKERLDLFNKVCQAIQHAHQKGIIHRDIKPSNILVTLHDGVPVPKVIDFGIAKATEGRLTDNTVYTQLHQFIGTPAYMSPEQAEMSGLDIDTRSDIYSLGVLLYELLAGSTPFDAKELMASGIDAMQKTIREKEPQRPGTRLATLGADQLTTTAKRRSADTSKLLHQLKGDLDWIVMKCLEKDHQRRYETANGLAACLKRHLNNEPVTARPPCALYRLQKMVRRNKAITVGFASVALALVLGLGLSMAALVRERAAQQRGLTQSVRADTVATFVDGLLSDAVPTMIQQGNNRGARELVATADRLATASLSNLPAADVRVRYKLARFYSLLQYPEGHLKQAEAIDQLISNLSDDQLPASRELLSLDLLIAWLEEAQSRGHYDEGTGDGLQRSYSRFMSQTPHARELAMICQTELGLWHSAANRSDKAEEFLSNAYRLRPNKPEVSHWIYRLPAQAERIARECLIDPPDTNPDARGGYMELVKALGDALCRQDRFDGAIQMLAAQRSMLVAKGVPEVDLILCDSMTGNVLARSGRIQDALAIFDSTATTFR